VPTNLGQLIHETPFDRLKGPDQYAPQNWATEYRPTWRDRIASQFMGDKVRSSEYERSVRNLTGSTGLGNTGPSLLDFVPFAGTAIGAQESAQEGDATGLVLSAVPFGGPLLKRGAKLANTTRQGVPRNNPRDWKVLRDWWDNTGYRDILSAENRAAIAARRTPRVDDSWIAAFPRGCRLERRTDLDASCRRLSVYPSACKDPAQGCTHAWRFSR
jgi:hypothetical protein